ADRVALLHQLGMPAPRAPWLKAESVECTANPAIRAKRLTCHGFCSSISVTACPPAFQEMIHVRHQHRRLHGAQCALSRPLGAVLAVGVAPDRLESGAGSALGRAEGKRMARAGADYRWTWPE